MRAASRSSGSSTSCMRCSRWSSRLVVMNFGRKICRRRARTRSWPAEVRKSIWASHGDHDPAARDPDLTAFYGDFQALFGITSRRRRRDRRDHRRQRRRQDRHSCKAIAGAVAAAPRQRAVRGRADRRAGAADIVRLGIAMVPEGRRLFPVAVRRGKSVDRRLRRHAAGHGRSTRVYALFPALQDRARRAGDRRCPAASSRWRRSAAP